MDIATLGAAIKRRIRKAKGKRLLDKAKRAIAVKKRLANAKKKVKKAIKPKKARALSKKTKVKAMLSRLPITTKKALIKNAIAKKPALKKKLVAAVLKQRLAKRMAGTYQAPAATAKTPIPAMSPVAPAARAPSSAPIDDDDTLSPSEAVEEESNEAPLSDAADDEVQTEEAAEEASNDAQREAAEEATEDSAEDEAAELSEPDSEEQEEQAEEAAEDMAEATEAAGDALLGAVFGKRLHRLRKRNRVNRILRAAAPIAQQLEHTSGGALPVKRTLKAVKVVAKAKAGDKKAKKGIKVLAKKAKGGNKPAKKAMAQLKIANKIIKKAKKTSKKPSKKTVKKLVKKVPYTKPVKVVNKGLYAYSAHQRGLAMIPGVARSIYGSK